MKTETQLPATKGPPVLPAFPLFLPLCSPLLHCIEATLDTVTNGGGSRPKLGLKKQKTTAPVSGVCPLLLGSLALEEAPYCVINSHADRPTWHGTEDSSRRPGRTETGRQPHAGAGKRNRRARWSVERVDCGPGRGLDGHLERC